jgi:3-dehydroquinate synthase
MRCHATLTHTIAPVCTHVHLGRNLLYSSECLSLLRQFPGRIAIITDTTIKTLIGDTWVDFLKQQGIDAALFSFSCGEESKNRQTKERLEDELMQAKCGKETLIIGLGGGVVTDLAGYIAATFLRGVRLMLIPTTLLGIVDAAIGGKTGVNTPFGKNLIGSFFPPEHLIFDFETLLTLPESEWRNGAAEIIKYGLISSPSLFNKLFEQSDQWHARNPEWIDEIIYASLFVKKQVIESDFQESGYRRILNFGHTIAHALEAAEHYRMPHGEAVSIGLLVEATLSHRLGILSQQELNKIEQILSMYALPVKLPSHVSCEQMLVHMRVDKKATTTHPRFVLLEAIGQVASCDQHYCREVPETLLKQVLSECLEGSSHE